MGTGLDRVPSWLIILIVSCLLLQPVSAFGAGNIASISKLEGHNWRHGDIEDMLKTLVFLKGRKWTSMMVKRVYFGNWLRDYSQAMDVGTLKSVQSDTIRILVWVLSFITFGYATEEFEVTQERLGVYRPEEHIDNPKDYADNKDARTFDSRLRGPVQQIELDIDPHTGMKNYIGNENLGIATSSGYIKFSLARSIHFGRVYTNGSGGTAHKEADLCEALRCLGQALHCLEDFGAHTNYVELALREIGYRDVFSHTGTASQINIQGHHVFPLVTGTFGLVDFVHSVLGEATDHFAQSEVSEVDQLNSALGTAQASSQGSGGKRGFGDSSDSGASTLTSLLSQVPGAGPLCQQAEQLEAASAAQEQYNSSPQGQYSSSRAAGDAPTFQAPPGSQGGPPGPGIPGMSPDFDPLKTAKQIYPILEFRDKVAKAISATIEKIPGLESLVEKITETLTMFILGLLAPFIRPIITAVSKQLKEGSSGVVDASGKHQFEPWTDPHCTDPTHSLLSKDHFSNILNEPAGQVAAVILQYVAPRVIYAWEHPDIPVDQVLNDVIRVFHHPAIRDRHCEIHNTMYSTVEKWARGRPQGYIDSHLNSEAVRKGKNHTAEGPQQHGGLHMPTHMPGHGGQHGGQHGGGHSGGGGLPSLQGLGDKFSQQAAANIPGFGMLQKFGKTAGLTREGEDFEAEIGRPQSSSDYPGQYQQPTHQDQGLWDSQQQSSYQYNQSPAQQYGYQGQDPNAQSQQGGYGQYGGQAPPDYQRQPYQQGGGYQQTPPGGSYGGGYDQNAQQQQQWPGQGQGQSYGGGGGGYGNQQYYGGGGGY